MVKLPFLLLKNMGGSKDIIYTSSQVQLNSRTYDQQYDKRMWVQNGIMEATKQYNSLVNTALQIRSATEIRENERM